MFLEIFYLFIIAIIISINVYFQNKYKNLKLIKRKRKDLLKLIIFIGISDIEEINIIKINNCINEILILDYNLTKNKIIKDIIKQLIKNKKKELNYNLRFYINDLYNFIILLNL
jgi:hypothetical protein